MLQYCLLNSASILCKWNPTNIVVCYIYIKAALHWPGMIVEFRIYQSLPKKKTTLIAVAEANFL